jgi:hypothetical protein
MSSASRIAFWLLLTGLLWLPCPCAFALDAALDVSQYAHTAWRIREGFSKGAINATAQTPDGYLWLGTEFGLLRFDGARNVTWRPPTDERLPGGAIHSLLSARDRTRTSISGPSVTIQRRRTSVAASYTLAWGYDGNGRRHNVPGGGPSHLCEEDRLSRQDFCWAGASVCSVWTRHSR